MPSDVSSTAVKIIEKRMLRAAQIRSGTLPTTDDLLDGLPFFNDDIIQDIRVWVDVALSYDIKGKYASSLPILRSVCSAEAVERSLEVLLETGQNRVHRDHEQRLQIYASCLGSTESTIRLQNSILCVVGRSDTLSFSNWIRRSVGEGMHIGMTSMCQAFDAGTMRLSALEDMTDKWNKSSIWISLGYPDFAGENPPPKPSKFEAIEKAIAAEDQADLLEAVLEDRAEYWRPRKRMTVVPLLDMPLTGHRKDVVAPWKGLSGMPLPIVSRDDVAGAREKLVSRWPHAGDLIDVILTDLASSEDVYFQPTLLIGQPGSGKSSLARAIAEAVNLPVELVSLAGAADSSLGGTSAQWHSARESIPLQLIRRSKTANPALIWDEVDKASKGSRNGDAQDMLLPLLERDQARKFRDPALEVECDLSFVSHFATANELAQVPKPLRDRMRILTMPVPDFRHIGALSQSILEDLMREKGLDPRWGLPFSADELDVMGAHWTSGSLRELKSIISIMTRGREANWGRA